ncbi:hypothetical protein KKF84_22155 [Myxococcota bacterium]|nr:hypothetical protein [Myxococcota bacterium]MBU1538032.1 hypothetical protein [Myxococcota bacterium]
MLKSIFKYQLYYFMVTLIALGILALYGRNIAPHLEGSCCGLSARWWFWAAVAVPIIHQYYVWFVWRIELFSGFFSRLMGMRVAFVLYSVGFTLLFLGRLLVLSLLALATRNTLGWPPWLSLAAGVIIIPPVGYMIYSVKRYFTLSRAYGIDHFDKEYNVPFVKGGLFKYTSNGMYTVGLLFLYLPAFFGRSEAALTVALFNHLYIWVHYYFTERPDMKTIYGTTPEGM